MRTMPSNAPSRWSLGLCAALLAACGGGGGGSPAADAALSFAQAPSLPAAPDPLPVSGAANVCSGYTVGSRDIENLQVPDGATCVLESGVRIDGNLELGTGSRLFARSIAVGGNVQGQRAATVLIEASTVGGSVQLDLGGEITARGNRIGGSIQLVGNGEAIHLVGNDVDSDIQLFENRGGAKLTDNVADGNLQCKENRPAPTGSGNRAASKEDQCAAL